MGKYYNNFTIGFPQIDTATAPYRLRFYFINARAEILPGEMPAGTTAELITDEREHLNRIDSIYLDHLKAHCRNEVK